MAFDTHSVSRGSVNSNPPEWQGALEAVGGGDAANPLAFAVGLLGGVRPDPRTVFQLLGGVGAANPLAAAVAALVPGVRPADRQNETSRWIATHGARIIPVLTDHLSFKLRISKGIRLVADHVQGFLLRLIEKDTLAPHLRAGLKVQDSVLRIWCYQFACTEARGWGTDASCRTTRGARTARERSPDWDRKPVQTFNTAREVVTVSDAGTESRDLYDPRQELADQSLERQERMRRARSLLHSLNQSEMAPYVGILRGVLAGRSLEALTRQYGVDPATLPGFAEKMRELLAAQAV